MRSYCFIQLIHKCISVTLGAKRSFNKKVTINDSFELNINCWGHMRILNYRFKNESLESILGHLTILR